MITTIPDRERALQAKVDALEAGLARLREISDAARAVLAFRVNEPCRGDLRDTDKSREALSVLDYAVAAYDAATDSTPPAQPAEPVQRLSDERAAFEAWHNEYRTQELVRRDDTYYNTHVRCRWEGWQARAIESALQPGWRDIESAPKDGSTVIVGRDMGHFGFIRGYARWECSIDGLVPGWISCGFDPVNSNLGLAHPTHWQPIPPAPKASHD